MGLGINISRTYYTCNNSWVCLKGGSLNIIKSGQIIIIHKPEIRPFGDDSPY